MQSVRPEQLTDEELLRHVYMMGNKDLPQEWVEELCKRLASALDDRHAEGFADGFAAANVFAEAEKPTRKQ